MLVSMMCLALAVQFWAAKAPSQWSDEELKDLLTGSPWAQRALGPREGEGPQVYLASARPMVEAEEELARRAATRPPTQEQEEESNDEYRDFLRENHGKYIVLAVAFPDPKRLEDPAELKRVENECVLKVGGKKLKMTGHFPPAGSDPWLRLVFPRAVSPADKSFRFELYLPGVPSPYRAAEFRVTDLYYKGALEM